MATYSGFRSYIRDQAGNILPGATITVRRQTDNAIATIYSTPAGAAKSNPFVIGADGLAEFYTAPGVYKVTAVSGAYTATIENVEIGAARDRIDDANASVALGTAAIANVTASASDVTTGRVVKVGDYGINGVGPTVAGIDYDSTLTSGVYFAQTGSAGAPTASAAYMLHVVGGKTTGSANNRAVQIAYEYDGASLSHYVRGRGVIGWSSWEEIHTTASIDDVAWSAPTLQNGWTQNPSGGLLFRVLFGVLFFSGAITAGTKTSGTLLFTLPVGSRPSTRRYVPVGALESGSDAGAYVRIEPDGSVYGYNINASQNNVVFNTVVRLA